MVTKKNLNIELLRCLSMGAVVLIHTSVSTFQDQEVMQNHAGVWVIINFYYAICRFCVPTFFLISAYLYLISDKPFNTLKRVKRILIPFFVWSIIYWLINGKLTLNDFSSEVLLSVGSFHLWFLVFFLGYSILLPLLLLFAKKDNKENYKSIIFLVLIFSIILPSFYQFGIDFHFYFKHILSFYLEIPQFLVFALILPFCLKKMNPFYGIMIYFMLVLINMIVNIMSAYYNHKALENWYSYTSIFVFTASIILFNLFINADLKFIKAKSASLIYKLGECTFGIYLCHVMILDKLKEIGLLMTDHNVVAPVINALIVFILSFILCLMARRIKIMRNIF